LRRRRAKDGDPDPVTLAFCMLYLKFLNAVLEELVRELRKNVMKN